MKMFLSGNVCLIFQNELRISKEAFVPIFDSRIDDNFHKIVLP